MQSGVINNDNMPQILRDISQKRKQGVLGITSGEEVIQIHFLSGRVIDASHSTRSAMEEVYERLFLSGQVNQGWSTFITEVDEEIPELGYETLFHQIKKVSGPIFETQYKHILKHKVLDAFYDIQLGAGAYYEFKVQMIDCEKDFLPSFSVGQLLLDLVSIEGDTERFESLFPPACQIECIGEIGVNSSFEERLIQETLQDGPKALTELKTITQLSRFHLMDSLLTLYDQKAVRACDGVSPSPTSDLEGFEDLENQDSDPDNLADQLSMVDDLVSQLENSIDETFKAEALEQVEKESRVESGDQESEDVEYDELEDGEEYDDEFDEEDDEDEYEYEYSEGHQPSIATRYQMLNMRALHSEVVPRLLSVLFVILALILPFMLWADLLKSFGA